VDELRPDYERVKTVVSSSEREQIDRHLQSLRDIGALLSQQASLNCSQPTIDFPNVDEDSPAPLHFGAVAEMVVAAIRCGLCNVFVVDSFYVSNAYHGLSHADGANTADVDAFLDFKRSQVKIVAQLATALDSAGNNPVTGRPYLDDTLICYVNELGDENSPGATSPYATVYFTHIHTFTNLQIVTVGNLGGQLRAGSYIDYSKPDSTPFNGHPVGVAYNQFLVTLAQALGVDAALYENGYAGIGDYRGYAENNITPQNHDVDTDAKRRAPLPYFWMG
jgi:hypothetical protein